MGALMARKELLIGLSVAALALAPGAAQAAHGKAGLWNVSTTMNMPNVQMPPEAVAQMKKMGVKMPAAQTFTSQICMTQAEVDSDKPPPMKNDTGCTTRMVNQTASSMQAEMICTGNMKGNGQMRISYSGAEHYVGSYNFRGSMKGQPMNMSSSFKGDWVKADCGAVKPYTAK
jgi:hypothetical protein